MSRDSVLVSADWAEKNLDTPGVVFVEVDEDTSAYDNGHIPGAVKLDWKKDLQDPVRRDFVNKEQFEALLSCRRSRRSGPATSRPRSACRGARPPTRTAPSSPTTSCASCTPPPASTTARTPSPTAGSASAPRTPGSPCTSCWARPG